MDLFEENKSNPDMNDDFEENDEYSEDDTSLLPSLSVYVY